MWQIFDESLMSALMEKTSIALMNENNEVRKK